MKFFNCGNYPDWVVVTWMITLGMGGTTFFTSVFLCTKGDAAVLALTSFFVAIQSFPLIYLNGNEEYLNAMGRSMHSDFNNFQKKYHMLYMSSYCYIDWIFVLLNSIGFLLLYLGFGFHYCGISGLSKAEKSCFIMFSITLFGGHVITNYITSSIRSKFVSFRDIILFHLLRHKVPGYYLLSKNDNYVKDLNAFGYCSQLGESNKLFYPYRPFYEHKNKHEFRIDYFYFRNELLILYKYITFSVVILCIISFGISARVSLLSKIAMITTISMGCNCMLQLLVLDVFYTRRIVGTLKDVIEYLSEPTSRHENIPLKSNNENDKFEEDAGALLVSNEQIKIRKRQKETKITFNQTSNIAQDYKVILKQPMFLKSCILPFTVTTMSRVIISALGFVVGSIGIWRAIALKDHDKHRENQTISLIV